MLCHRRMSCSESSAGNRGYANLLGVHYAILAPRSVFALPRLLGMVVRLAAWEFRKEEENRYVVSEKK